MEHPDYVLRAEEAVLVPKKDTEILVKLKPAVWIVIGIIIILSFIFGDNIYKELSWTARGLLVALAMGIFLSIRTKECHRPLRYGSMGTTL